MTNMKTISPKAVKTAVCGVLGIDINKTKSVTIKLDHGAPIVEVVRYITTGESKQIAEVLSTYALHKKRRMTPSR